MITIIFATEAEARPFLKSYYRGRFDGLAEDEVVSDDQITLLITGSGKVKATLRTERLLSEIKTDRIVHVGSCQSLVEELPLGTVIQAIHVLEGDRIELSAPTYPRMPLIRAFDKVKEARLITQDHTIQGQTELTYWQRIADVSDMTGYAIAYVAATHGVPCTIAKVVAGIVGQEDINLLTRMDESYEVLGTFLDKNLEKMLEMEAKKGKKGKKKKK